MTEIVKDLRNLVDQKVTLKSQFEKVKDELERIYPAIVDPDRESKTIVDDINSELDFLLSSSLKNKTGRYEIKMPTNWKKEVILTRKPGLSHPYNSYPVILWIPRVSEIHDNGDVMYRGKGIVKLSVLKDHPKIDQDKLSKFYEVLKKAKKAYRDLEALINPNSYNFELDDLAWKGMIKDKEFGISLGHEGFAVCWIGLREGKRRKKEVKKFLKFSFLLQYWDTSQGFGDLNLEDQQVVAKNWNQFDKALLELDEEKAQVMRNLKSIFKELKDVNKNFRILQKLT